MKRLLTLSLLLLFSVDVFADDMCQIMGDGAFVGGISAVIEKECSKGETLWLQKEKDYDFEILTLNRIAGFFCDFENQIIINTDETHRYLLCTLNDNQPREITNLED